MTEMKTNHHKCWQECEAALPWNAKCCNFFGKQLIVSPKVKNILFYDGVITMKVLPKDMYMTVYGSFHSDN